MDNFFTSSIELNAQNARRLLRVISWRIKRLRFHNKLCIFIIMAALYTALMYLFRLHNHLSICDISAGLIYCNAALVLLPFIIGWYDHIVASRVYGHMTICFFELILVAGITCTYILP